MPSEMKCDCKLCQNLVDKEPCRRQHRRQGAIWAELVTTVGFGEGYGADIANVSSARNRLQ